MSPLNVYDAAAQHIIGAAEHVVKTARYRDFLRCVDTIVAHPRVFVSGAGRSGLVGRFFAMRLMHTGSSVHVVGDTTTPSATCNDLVIAISGSGNTRSVVSVATQAKECGATVLAISCRQKSALEGIADLTIGLEPPSDSLARTDDGLNLLPMGTVFELGALVYLESVVAEIIRRQMIPEDRLKSRHANLE